MKNRWMVSSLVSGARLLILGGHAKAAKAEAVDVNAGPAGNEWTKVMADQEEHTINSQPAHMSMCLISVALFPWKQLMGRLPK